MIRKTFEVADNASTNPGARQRAVQEVLFSTRASHHDKWNTALLPEDLELAADVARIMGTSKETQPLRMALFAAQVGETVHNPFVLPENARLAGFLGLSPDRPPAGEIVFYLRGGAQEPTAEATPETGETISLPLSYNRLVLFDPTVFVHGFRVSGSSRVDLNVLVLE